MSGLTVEVERCRVGLLDGINQTPEDLMFGLSASFRADADPRKVDLGVGTYRDEKGKPFVLPVVKEARMRLEADPALNHEYLPIDGLPTFVNASQQLLLGLDNAVLLQGRIASVQQVSGTGALHLGASLLAQFSTLPVFVSSPAYANHLPILRHVGFETDYYPYYCKATKGLDFTGMIETIRGLPPHTIILLHACAHNPTGVDLNREQWTQLASVMQDRNHVPFFDAAYQGFATGDVDEDAWAIRHFVARDFPTILIAQSYAKNFGLYGERAGCLHVIASSNEVAKRILSQLKRLQRVEISTPPAHGARIVATILNDVELREQWRRELKEMAARIMSMRMALRERLEAGHREGAWGHITEQRGMFCFSGLKGNEVKLLRDEWHVYATPDGRLSVSGLNHGNLDYVANAIKAVTACARL